MISILCLALLTDAQSLVQEGNDLFRSKQYEAAEAKYLDARIDTGDSPTIAFNLGTIFLAREDYAKARDNYQEALQSRDPVLEAKIKYNMGHTYFGEAQTGLEDLSDPEKVTRTTELLHQAIRRWRDVLRLEPEHVEARQNILVAMRVLKDYLDRVKRYQEEQRKKEEEKKKEGQNLAEILQDLLKRQEEEKGRTDEIMGIQKEIETLRPVEARYSGVEEALEKALAGEANQEALEKIRTDVTAILADPNVVEGATSLQDVEKALGVPEPKAADASASMAKAVKQIHDEVVQREETTAAEHTTGKENQTRLNVETQGVTQGIDAQLAGQTGGSQALGPPSPQPGHGPPVQPPPMPPQQRKLFEDVKAIVQVAVGHQTEALKHLELGGLALPELTGTATEQQGAVERLREALERLQEEQDKQNQKQNQQDKKQEQKKEDQDQQDQQKQEGKKEEKRKSVSRQEAEEIVRRIKEKEQQKKREKRRQLLKVMGRRGAKYDW